MVSWSTDVRVRCKDASSLAVARALVRPYSALVWFSHRRFSRRFLVVMPVRSRIMADSYRVSKKSATSRRTSSSARSFGSGTAVSLNTAEQRVATRGMSRSSLSVLTRTFVTPADVDGASSLESTSVVVSVARWGGTGRRARAEVGRDGAIGPRARAAVAGRSEAPARVARGAPCAGARIANAVIAERSRRSEARGWRRSARL